MDNRPASEYAQPGSHHPDTVTDAPSEQKPADQTSAAAAHYTPQPEVRPTPQYTPQPEVRPNISSANTPQSDYGLNPPPARSPAYQDYLHRPPQSYTPNSQPGGAAGMAQATSPFNTLPTGPRSPHSKSDAPVPIDPSLPANSPTYPPPYSPYQPQGHEMAQYQGHPPPPQHMYARPDWPHSYGQQHHGLPGPYASPATTVGSTSPAAFLGRRASKVYSFVPIPGAQQHKRPRRRYEEIERMYKCGWNGCEKAYGTLNHLNAHVTMQSHGAKRTPEEFKEIRKEWKARKKEEEAQRKAIEERERAAAQAAQANQVEPPNSSDPSHGQPPAYAGGVRPQLPPIGYQPADSQVPSQYGGPPSSGMVYQNNGQMAYPPNYPHSPYQSGPVYPQRE
ncbi:Zinc finger, C2H2 [Penicillium griseofulvum]|uniref:Zinc finger, C2H2 n=1 Tax=Penicillium patulum TaxID=5078 RepID=A0A135LYV1_PENPA|nr:Zinc finger, C2H2 [Penicillium griseofulvum]KXG54140.1 Zinc finger, C2H2 [Penicillium griseofulvum]